MTGPAWGQRLKHLAGGDWRGTGLFGPCKQCLCRCCLCCGCHAASTVFGFSRHFHEGMCNCLIFNIQRHTLHSTSCPGLLRQMTYRADYLSWQCWQSWYYAYHDALHKQLIFTALPYRWIVLHFHHNSWGNLDVLVDWRQIWHMIYSDQLERVPQDEHSLLWRSVGIWYTLVRLQALTL